MRFRYDLRKIDGLVTRDIPNLIELHFHVSQELLNDFKLAVDEEAEQIKGKFSTAVVLYNRDQIMKQYFTYHQQSLIRLSAELVRFNTASIGASVAEYGILCNHLIDTIEKLLLFISRQYSKFTDFNTWLPSSYRLFALRQARTNLSALENRLFQLNVSQQLINLVMLPFRQFLVIGTTDEATYGKVYFLKALYDEILDLISSPNRLDISEDIQQRLIYVNYNSQDFFAFHTQQLTLYYKTSDHLGEQVERLAIVQRALSQLPVKQSVSFDFTQRSIKERLLEWIVQETELLETKMDIMARMNEDEKDFVQTESSKSFKFKLNASVAQVAYFVKVLIETSVVETTSVVTLLKSVTRIFQTKRSGKIGYGSLHARYYNVESGARRGVKKILLKMINHIDRTEGIA